MHERDAQHATVAQPRHLRQTQVERVATLDTQKCRVLAGGPRGIVFASIGHHLKLRWHALERATQIVQVGLECARAIGRLAHGVRSDHPGSAADLGLDHARKVDKRRLPQLSKADMVGTKCDDDETEDDELEKVEREEAELAKKHRGVVGSAGNLSLRPGLARRYLSSARIFETQKSYGMVVFVFVTTCHTILVNPDCAVSALGSVAR